MVPRLIVVDDEARQMEALTRTLTPEGYDVTGFSDPRGALETLRQQSFDVLLTDLMMPGMDGIMLMRAALELDPDLVAVMMTGHGTVSTAVDAMKVGALDYILKPFNLSAIRPVLARAVDVRRLRVENIRLREAMGIYEVSTTIARSLDSQTVLTRVADAAFEQSRAAAVRVYAANAAGSELQLVAARTRDGGEPAETNLPVTGALVSWATRQRAWLAAVAGGEGAPAEPAPEPGRVAIPMFAESRFTGLLTFQSAPPLRPIPLGQIKALSVLANAGAAALEVSALLEHLRRTNDDLRKFAWAASHDLQEPLREVALNVELLGRRLGAVDAESTALLATASAGARRMLAMIHELRTFVEAGEVAADADLAADSGAALDRVLRELQTAIEAARAEIRHGALPIVRMRERHLEDVFRRLLDNALKFRRPDRPPRIDIEANGHDGEWTFVVRDNGIGIAPRFHAQVFELFQRLNRREEFEGNGMGLPVCRRLVEAYGGRVWVESEEGAGARFQFVVPAAPAPAGPLTAPKPA
jgi:signal transduction histidine kinase